MRRHVFSAYVNGRERWNYDGRQTVQGVDCYLWVRYLDKPTSDGFTKMACAYPVATFWPVGGER